ncbi:circadian clock protein LdpA [Egbenema bharatensis]|uniref:circadian clock protein LdpA n=1 Tax=Egbenema bharatensis TaxID=3463334 RepID=UPI003A851A29
MDLYHPLRSLREGSWFKLICGASFQHLPAIRNLVLAYTLAGADCVDVAADPAVINAARSALAVASHWQGAAEQKGFNRAGAMPWLMVSLNDGEDPHFRKATFDPEQCPPDCARPCEAICPAQAIVFNPSYAGVVEASCYGCGRCVPICPIQTITTRSYVSTPASIAPLVLSGVDAVEIHTQVGRLEDFKRLWAAIRPFVFDLKLIAISCPDGEGLIDYLWALYDIIRPLPCSLIWQTDGRPMSGDIGAGATRAAVKLGQKVLQAGPPGYVQLAGGTNSHTAEKLKALGLLHQQDASSSDRLIAGIAYGSYARALLAPVLEQLEHAEIRNQAWESPTLKTGLADRCWSMPQARFLARHLEEEPDLLWQAVHLAHSLVSQLKPAMKFKKNIPKISGTMG